MSVGACIGRVSLVAAHQLLDSDPDDLHAMRTYSQTVSWQPIHLPLQAADIALLQDAAPTVFTDDSPALKLKTHQQSN